MLQWIIASLCDVRITSALSRITDIRLLGRSVDCNPTKLVGRLQVLTAYVL
jgi:hypothetical protein